jgi:hypothetical protein
MSSAYEIDYSEGGRRFGNIARSICYELLFHFELARRFGVVLA